MLQTTVPEHRQARATFDFLSDEQTVEVVHAGHRIVVEPDDHVSGAHPSRFSRGTWHEFVNPHARTLRQLKPPCKGLINRGILAGDTKVTAPNAPFLDEPTRHELRCLAPNRKTDALRGRNNRRIYTDNLPNTIDERTSGIPWIQGRVRLNDVIDQASCP